MRLLSLVSLIYFFVFIASCTKEVSKELPPCIKNITEDSVKSVSLKTVKVQRVRGELHYWLNTDYRHMDGLEFIVNEQCDTLCSFCGECIPAECIDDYCEDDWVTIWEK